MENLILGHKL